MPITFADLYNSEPSAWGTSAESWDRLLGAASGHAEDLQRGVTVQLSGNWAGIAAEMAGRTLTATHGAMTASAARISQIKSALITAQSAFEKAKSDLVTAVGSAKAAGYAVNMTTGALSIPAGASAAERAALGAKQQEHQSAIDSSLTEANSVDQEVAASLGGLMPPGAFPEDGGGSGGGPEIARGAGAGPVPTGTSNVSDKQARAMGQRMAAQRGWTGAQWNCLDQLWQRESGWNPNAQNPDSGAFGIPQSLPPQKMASAGSDWQSNPATQIKWGLEYIYDTYGTPCAAWAHETSYGWY